MKMTNKITTLSVKIYHLHFHLQHQISLQVERVQKNEMRNKISTLSVKICRLHFHLQHQISIQVE